MDLLRIRSLQSCACGKHSLALQLLDEELMLRLHLTHEEAEALSVELEGQSTMRSRMGATLLLVATKLGAEVRAVRMRRSAANRLEALLILTTDAGELTLPASPMDAISLVLRRNLPIEADPSIAPWLHPLTPAAEELLAAPEAALAPSIQDFLTSLPDFAV